MSEVSPHLSNARVGHVAMPRSTQLRRYRNRALVFVCLSVLLLGIAPWAFGAMGRYVLSEAEEELWELDKGDFAALSKADRMFEIQGWAPWWGETARRSRVGILEEVLRLGHGFSSGIEPHTAPAGTIGATIEFVTKRLPVVATQSAESYELRERFEIFLHRWGRDQEILDLDTKMPPGGNIQERVRAHLYLGDLDGAAERWRKPGAVMSTRFGNLAVSKPVVLCMAGDFVGAISAFEDALPPLAAGFREERRRSTYEDFRLPLAGGFGRERRRLSWAYLECLIAANEPDLIEKFMVQLESISLADSSEASHLWTSLDNSPRTLIAYARLTLALQRDQAEVRDSLLDSFPSHTHPPFGKIDLTRRVGSLRAVALARAGKLDLLVGLLTEEELERHLETGGNLAVLRVNESHLREVAKTLAETREHPRLLEIHQVASALYCALAFRLGIRWDPEAQHILNLAAKLNPDSTLLKKVRFHVAFLHGEWSIVNAIKADPEDEEMVWLKAMKQEIELDPTIAIRSWQQRIDEADMYRPRNLDCVNVGPGCYLELQRILTGNYANSRKIDRLRENDWGSIDSERFTGLTMLIVYGEGLGANVSQWKDQLSALRAMYDSQSMYLDWFSHAEY